LPHDASRWLAAAAVAYGLMHHTGSWLSGLGTIGETRWADWIDLLTPYAILVCTGAALRASQAGWTCWAVFLAGAITYTEGHGIHLAANSIGNVDPSDAAHLWDEVVGHYLWQAGTVLVVAAIGIALAEHRPPRGLVPYALALLAGITAGTNSLEGGTAPLGIAAAVAFATWGWLTRRGLGRFLLVAYLSALALLVAYGLWHSGFPQPSELG
jgi:hypothetical protein